VISGLHEKRITGLSGVPEAYAGMGQKTPRAWAVRFICRRRP